MPDDQWSDQTRARAPEYTSGEADAWRAGRDAAAARLQRMAEDMRRHGKDRVLHTNIATLEVAAEAIAAMEPGRPEPDGLCGRGA